MLLSPWHVLADPYAAFLLGGLEDQFNKSQQAQGVCCPPWLLLGDKHHFRNPKFYNWSTRRALDTLKKDNSEPWWFITQLYHRRLHIKCLILWGPFICSGLVQESWHLMVCRFGLEVLWYFTSWSWVGYCAIIMHFSYHFSYWFLEMCQ